jgi:hypothetical protein
MRYNDPLTLYFLVYTTTTYLNHTTNSNVLGSLASLDRLVVLLFLNLHGICLPFPLSRDADPDDLAS